eukprot:scaffold250610_cov30-Tisochrysis_lutea.AAC.11
MRNQHEYSPAAKPTPPAPACSSAWWPVCGRAAKSDMCTVLHVVGNVQACSNESDLSIEASKRESLLEIEARAARPWPRAASSTRK